MTERTRTMFAWHTHSAMIPVIVDMLANDGCSEAHRFLLSPAQGRPYWQVLSQAVADADLPTNRGYVPTYLHFHHPWTHRGYVTAASATDCTAARYAAAVGLWRSNPIEALYQLGRGLHVVQDLWIPHHAALTALRGHGAYERWLERNWRQAVVSVGGQYRWQREFRHPRYGTHRVHEGDPRCHVDLAAHVSAPLTSDDPASFPATAAELIPACLRHSAGFLYLFFGAVGLD